MLRVVCYLRGYDYRWNCLSEVYYSNSRKAEKDCNNLNRNPCSELNYRVECEMVRTK